MRATDTIRAHDISALTTAAFSGLIKAQGKLREALFLAEKDYDIDDDQLRHLVATIVALGGHVRTPQLDQLHPGAVGEGKGNTPKRRCPVCWRPVAQTVHETIEGHWDSLGTEPCVGIGEPYRITLKVGKATVERFRRPGRAA